MFLFSIYGLKGKQYKVSGIINVEPLLWLLLIFDFRRRRCCEIESNNVFDWPQHRGHSVSWLCRLLFRTTHWVEKSSPDVVHNHWNHLFHCWNVFFSGIVLLDLLFMTVPSSSSTFTESFFGGVWAAQSRNATHFPSAFLASPFLQTHPLLHCSWTHSVFHGSTVFSGN